MEALSLVKKTLKKMNQINYIRLNVLKICILLLSIPIIKAHAQLNRNDTLNWQVKFSASSSLLDGNVARFLLLNSFEIAYAKPNFGMTSRNDYQYGTTRHIKSENDFVSRNFFYVNPLRKIRPYLMVTTETNYRRKIEFRYQVGLGISIKIAEKNNNLFRMAFGTTYERTRFGGMNFEKLNDTLSNILTAWRATGRVYGKQQVFKSKLKLTYEFWWQQSINDIDDYRFHNEDALEIPLSKIFNFRTSFRYSYENIRIKGLKPYDLFWTFGLSVSNF
jgi:Protein of unknown function, DUF481